MTREEIMKCFIVLGFLFMFCFISYSEGRVHGYAEALHYAEALTRLREQYLK